MRLVSLSIVTLVSAHFDSEITDDAAGIAARAGRVSFTIGLPSGEVAQVQPTTLAARVLARSASLQ